MICVFFRAGEAAKLELVAGLLPSRGGGKQRRGGRRVEIDAAAGDDIELAVGFLNGEEGEAVAEVVGALGADGGGGADFEFGGVPGVSGGVAREKVREVVRDGDGLVVGVAGEVMDTVGRHGEIMNYEW